MALETFKQNFLSTCKQENVMPQDFILEAISCSSYTSSQNYVLDLSTKNFNTDVSKILSACLRHDNTFEEILFNDCMLSSDCLQIIIDGLCDNGSCSKLSLKGNNIKNQGCESLAKLVRQNTSIKYLSIEWNLVGLSRTGFQHFCNSLALNKYLLVLDFRNNQIGLDNCKMLIDALKNNNYLTEIDLRYNCLGVAGGNEILKLLDKNRTISKLLVLGNNIPLDTIKYIENLTNRNEEIQRAKQKSYSNKISLDYDPNSRKQQKIDLLDKIDQTNGFRMSDKKCFAKMVQLEKLLEERRQKCQQLSANLHLAESKIELYGVQMKDMESHFQKSLKEREFLERQYNLQNDKERDFRVEMEKRYMTEQNQLQERILQLQDNIGELEINLKQQNDTINVLKEKILATNATNRSKQLEYEEQISGLKEQHKINTVDIIQKNERELYKLKQEYNTNEEEWRNKLVKNDDIRDELIQEISRLKNQISSDKIMYEENIHQIKQKMRNEEEQKTFKLTEELRTINVLKEEIESQNSRQCREIDSLQKENSKLKIETESLKIKRDNLTEELSGKQAEMISEIEKVRFEWMNRVQKLENERQSQIDLFAKIDQQDKQIQEMKNSFREDLHERNNEIQSLKDKLKCQEIEINRRQEDEKMRANALHNAVQQYCQPTLSRTLNES